MKTLLFAIGVLITPFFVAGLAFGQAGTVGIYADVSGTDPYLHDTGPGLIELYVVHISAPGATACQFAAYKPPCFNATYLCDEPVFPVTFGNSQTGVSIGYPSCQSTPIHVLTMKFWGEGLTGNCCEYWVVPHPYGDGLVQMVDCDFKLHDAQGGIAIINPGGCQCEQPELWLGGYQTVSWEDPFWAVQVHIQNFGYAPARNVSATMHEDIPWLINPDPNCFYGDIPNGESSWGGSDTYVFDLTNHPGGGFNAWFDVSYEDTCGDTHTLRLDPGFDPDKDTTPGPDVVANCRLGQNYPNPFNPTTIIPVDLSEDTDVRLSVFDSRGTLVRVLADNRMSTGVKEIMWDGRDGSGNLVSSGIYFCKLEANASTQTRKLVLLK